MNYGIIGEYPTPLNDDQVKCYVSVLLCVADVDGISSGEMSLIRDLAANANVPNQIVDECLEGYKSFDHETFLTTICNGQIAFFEMQS